MAVMPSFPIPRLHTGRINKDCQRKTMTVSRCLQQKRSVGVFRIAGSQAHRKFKRPLKPDDQTRPRPRPARKGGRDDCGSEIVAAVPIQTVSQLPLVSSGLDLPSQSQG